MVGVCSPNTADHSKGTPRAYPSRLMDEAARIPYNRGLWIREVVDGLGRCPRFARCCRAARHQSGAATQPIT